MTVFSLFAESPPATEPPQWITSGMYLMDASMKLGVFIYPTYWAFKIFKRIFGVV